MEQNNGWEMPASATAGLEDAVAQDPARAAVLWLRGLYHELVGPADASEMKSQGIGMSPVENSPGASSSNGKTRPTSNYVVQIDELVVEEGSFLALLGPSGCGKTTLLTILGLARQPSRQERHLPSVEQFQVYERIDGNGQFNIHDIVELWGKGQSGREIESLRRSFLGFALQSGELLPNLTVYENVEMPLRLNRVSAAMSRQRVETVLKQFGTANEDGTPSDKLWNRRKNLPDELSGGEYQRVAIARALAHQPHILFLDEPTNNLDPKTAGMAIAALVRLQRDEGLTVVMITHDRELAARFATHIVEMDSPRPGLGHIERRWVRGKDSLWRLASSRWSVSDPNSASATPTLGPTGLPSTAPGTARCDGAAANSDSRMGGAVPGWRIQRLARKPPKVSLTMARLRRAWDKVRDAWARRYDVPD